MRGTQDLDAGEYHALAEFRYQIRRFLQFSEEAARTAGVEPQQHQLLLAVKGLPPASKPTIGELARRLFLKHHSAVELVDRLERHQLVTRVRNPQDAREVLVHLTRDGEALLRRLSLAHRAELEATGPELARLLKKAIRGKKGATKAA